LPLIFYVFVLMEETLRKDEIFGSYSSLYGDVERFNSYCSARPVCSSMNAVAILIKETQSNMKNDGFSKKMPVVSL